MPIKCPILCVPAAQMAKTMDSPPEKFRRKGVGFPFLSGNLGKIEKNYLKFGRYKVYYP